MTNEEILTNFMREHYTDERLCWLLEHARSGKLSYNSCCCFIGIVTSDHALKSFDNATLRPWFVLRNEHDYLKHLESARIIPGAKEAEGAFCELAPEDQSVWFFNIKSKDEIRRAKLIPLIEAEIARRDALKAKEIEPCKSLSV